MNTFAPNYTFHKDGTKPTAADSLIFVFGSNLRGRHGLGAALEAKRTFGAINCVAEGITGRSYAIPTKDVNIQTLPIEIIKGHIERFVEFAHNNTSLMFFVTRIGCGLAGYKDNQIAGLFKGAPENCNFPDNWKKYLITEVSPIKDTAETSVSGLIMKSRKIVF